MELDDLKQTWKRSQGNINPVNKDIIAMIQDKSYGPVAGLKKRFRRQLIIFPLIVTIVINNLSQHHYLFNDVLFWSYIFFCCVVASYFYINYRFINRLQKMDDPIKSNLQEQVKTLEARFKWHPILIRVMLVTYIVLVEILTYFHLEPSLQKWHAFPWYFRLVIYLVALLLMYSLNKVVFKRKYGKHLANLKQLVNEMK